MPAYHSCLHEGPDVAGFPLTPIRRTHPALQTTRGPAPFVEAGAAEASTASAAAAAAAAAAAGTAAAVAAAGSAAPAAEDAVDEALRLFRPNVLFRNFELQGNGDRTLTFLMLAIQQSLRRLEKKGAQQPRAEATKELMALAQAAPVIPGDAGWPLGGVIAAPRSAAESEQLRLLTRQLREALAGRLLDRVYAQDPKHWLAFAKKKFMGKELV
jgi:actin related protein 2/3 complex subunit 3